MDPLGCEATARVRLRERAAEVRRAERIAPMLAGARSDVPVHRVPRVRRFVGTRLVRIGEWIGGLDDGRAVLSPAVDHEWGR